MNKRVVRRILETFFDRWWLYLLPVLLFIGVGVQQASSTSTGFRSVGVVDVSSGTLLSELSSVRGDLYGYETPATVTSRQINSLLRTDQFIEAIAESAGVDDALQRGDITPLQIRSAISAGADGDTLLQVAAMTDVPELSARLAQGTISSFIEYVTNGDVSDSRAAEAFFQIQVELYETDVEAAEQALEKYAADNPGPATDRRPFDEQLAIGRLTDDVTAAKARLDNARAKSEEARLASEQAVTDVAQRLRIVDQPVIAGAPEPRLKDMAFTLVIFMTVGFLLSAGALILGTFADRSLRSADDVEFLLGLPVIASIPDTRALA